MGMSREHLYKAKRVNWRELPKEGWWVYGNLVLSNKVDKEYTAIIIPKEDSGMFSESDNDDLGFETWYLVVPETVREYTGLTDKNGGRFEGDVFQASDGDYIQRYIIAWNEDSLEWSAECIGNPDGTLPLCEFKVGEIDVIGNVFDNPEILKGGEEE